MRRTSIAALAAALSLVAVPAAAVDSPPSPSDPVLLMPGAGYLGGFDDDGVLITDDAVFVLGPDNASYTFRDSILFTRSLASDDTTVDLGPSTRIARASGYTMAADAGTLAYLRRVDGRLVLRASDGTETMPAWGNADAIVANGPGAMTASWLAAGSVVYDRQDGTAYDLAGISTVPPNAIYGDGTWHVALSESRAVWSVTGTDEAYTGTFGGVWTVALGESGPEGPVTTLQSGVADPDDFTAIEPLGVVGDRIVWSVSGGTVVPYTRVTEVRSVPLASPDATPTGWATSGIRVVDADSTEVAVAETDTEVRWMSPADFSIVRTYTHQGPFLAPMSVWGDLLVTGGFNGWDVDMTFVTDTAGRTMTANAASPTAPPTFRDVTSGNPFRNDVSWLAELGISRGYSDGTYRPSAAVARDAMAAFMYRLAGEPAFTAPATSPFKDVPTTHPFYKEISWLSAMGISTGTVTPTGRYYKPSDPVSREAMAAFLYRFAGQPVYDWAPDEPMFEDVAPSHPFYAGINWMGYMGISTGTATPTGAKYQPSGFVSREAMAAFMHRLHMAGETHPWN